MKRRNRKSCGFSRMLIFRFGDGVEVGDVPDRAPVRDGAGGAAEQLLRWWHCVLSTDGASKNNPHHSKPNRLQPTSRLRKC